MPAIRPAAVVGSFYPAAATELRSEIVKLLGSTETGAIASVPKVLIAPHAGYIYSGPIAAAGYRRLAPAREHITRVVVLGPSHFVGFRGLAASSAEDWQTPLGTVPVDRPMVEHLIKAKLIGVLDAAHAQEHSLEVHLPFLQVALGKFALVPIVAGDASPEAVADVLDAVWAGPETLIVVSTDLSHYLDYRSCLATDRQTAAAIERFDPRGLGPESACGRVPVRGLLTAAKRRGMSIARLDLRNSGDTAGPRDRVVGYGSWALFEPAGQQKLVADGFPARRAERLAGLCVSAIQGALIQARVERSGVPIEMAANELASMLCELAARGDGVRSSSSQSTGACSRLSTSEYAAPT